MFKYCGMLLPHTCKNILNTSNKRNAYGCMISFQHNKIIKMKKKNIGKVEIFFVLPTCLHELKIQSVGVYWTPRCNAGFHKSYTMLTYDYMKMIKIMKSSTNIIIECYFHVHISIRRYMLIVCFMNRWKKYSINPKSTTFSALVLWFFNAMGSSLKKNPKYFHFLRLNFQRWENTLDFG